MSRPTWLPSSAKKGNKELVYQTNAAYFNPVSRIWQNGTITLHPRCIEFLSAESADESVPLFHLALPLCSVSSIKKRTSFFIYAAIVIEVGSESHWFSSLSHRDSLFNLIELFWRDVLLSRSSSATFSPSRVKSPSLLGKQLLQMLRQSENTLSHTASELEQQSKQLQEAHQALHDLNADLSAAEKSLHHNPDRVNPDGNSSSHEQGYPALLNARKILNSKRKHKVTFARHDEIVSAACCWEKGLLFVADQEIDFTDEEGNIGFRIPTDEIQEIQVVTPWQLHIRQFKDEKVTCYDVMCPTLVQLYKTLRYMQQFSVQLTCTEDINLLFKRQGISACNSSTSVSSYSGASSSSSAGSLSPDIPQIIQQVQRVQSSGSLLQEETQEISSVLENLQTLSSEVNKEQRYQMEKIEQLITDVNKTELRLNVDNKIMKKMT